MVIDLSSLLTVHRNSKVQKGNGYKLSHSHDIQTLYCTLTITYFVLPAHIQYTRVHVHADNIVQEQRSSVIHVIQQLHNSVGTQKEKAETTADLQYPLPTQNIQNIYGEPDRTGSFLKLLFTLRKNCAAASTTGRSQTNTPPKRSWFISGTRFHASEQLWAGNQKGRGCFRLGNAFFPVRHNSCVPVQAFVQVVLLYKILFYSTLQLF